MKYNPDIHNRRSLRLKGYDYSQAGAYFVTICTHKRESLFGGIQNGKMLLNQYGEVVDTEWKRSFEIRKEMVIDYYQIMPNHIHGIVLIQRTIVGASGRSPLQNDGENYDKKMRIFGIKLKSLSSLMAGFKSSTTKIINQLRNTPGNPLWQRNFYEHIIRNEKELNELREYIINNPLNWELDEDNPNNIRT